ncbi:hypothetical protein COO60DRAFT_803507 [Scenedesmus sp. NREL 46B-D3]|nr:hypothetical protein COO60DRAFT_803507 [Scenedesmus sp. NREL 46B-D3]
MKQGSPSAGDRTQHLCHDGDSVDSFSVLSDSKKHSKLTKAHKILIAACAALLVVGIVVAVAVTQAKPKSSQPGELLSDDYCIHLPDAAEQHCHEYFVSQGGAKFTAAADWRHYNPASYDCSGIDADCLNVDLQSNAAGTVCRPLQEGSPCGSNQRCMAGVCGGAATCAFLPDNTADIAAMACSCCCNLP